VPFLEESQEREEQRLEQELKRIEEQLEEREAIREQHITELEGKLEWYVDRLEKLYKRASSPDEIEELKQQITGFYEEIRWERRRAWQDKQELEEKRREILRELTELDDDAILEYLAQPALD
jgi:hypothetical protein